MTNLDDSWGVKNGVWINEELFITGGSAEPFGLDLPIGTVYHQIAVDGIKIWKHFNTGVNDWQTVNSEIYSNSPPPLTLSHNGTLSNNQLVGYTNLANNAVVIGFKCKLAKITSVNGNNNADYALDFFDGFADGGNNNGFFRHTVTNNVPLTADVTGSPVFDIGDRLGIYLRDLGQNPNDLNLSLFFEAVE